MYFSWYFLKLHDSCLNDVVGLRVVVSNQHHITSLVIETTSPVPPPIECALLFKEFSSLLVEDRNAHLKHNYNIYLMHHDLHDQALVRHVRWKLVKSEYNCFFHSSLGINEIAMAAVVQHQSSTLRETNLRIGLVDDGNSLYWSTVLSHDQVRLLESHVNQFVVPINLTW